MLSRGSLNFQVDAGQKQCENTFITRTSTNFIKGDPHLCREKRASPSRHTRHRLPLLCCCSPLPPTRRQTRVRGEEERKSNFPENTDYAYLVGLRRFYQSGRLHLLVWDETSVHLTELDPNIPQIWASSTLYSPEVRMHRKEMFNAWLESDPSFDQESIMRFHQSEKTDAENGLLIHRSNGLKTVSVTSVERHDAYDTSMVYRDLIGDVTSSKNLSFIL